MNGLAPLLFGLLAGDVEAAARRARRLALYYALAGLFGLIALAALVAALAIYLGSMFGVQTALLMICLSFAGLSLLALAAASVRASRNRRRQANQSMSPKLMATLAFGLLPTILGNKMLFGIAAAALAGYAAARTPSGEIARRRTRAATARRKPE